MPDYISLFSGVTRLRSCQLDRLSYVSSVLPKCKNGNILKKSFLYRVHLSWNELSFEIREIRCPSTFKRAGGLRSGEGRNRVFCCY